MESSGVRKFFERHWEKMILWTILIGLFYLLRPFFAVIFGTFLIAYVARNVVQWLVKTLNLNYRLATVLFFISFLAVVIAAGIWIGPKLVMESNKIFSEFADDNTGQTNEKINRFAENIVKQIIGEEKGKIFIGSEEYTNMLESLKAESSKTLKSWMPHVFSSLLTVIKLGWTITVVLLLSTLFSFMIVMDWQKIAGKMKELENSRIRTFYLGAAPHLQAFARVFGKALQAQAIIAICNTILTAIGLWYFQVPNIALLSTIVLICGFIPILGTFMSSIPILIFGIQDGGLDLVLKLIVFVAAIHAFEAYVLNPRITGEALRAHPLLILVLLLVCERFFGIWGMIVGVPLGFYLISVLSTKDEEHQPEPVHKKP
ncbi:MAG TPA: hypothetical protein DCZ94_05040 [Lentisphaeria bacterium]|nr:MAG: hypothetical protein A2X48_07770 [Lentisphaerae bacterium GWF2_49_21]HBC86303.1 hypothetical protein [Lentisphaeria bacterium]